MLEDWEFDVMVDGKFEDEIDVSWLISNDGDMDWFEDVVRDGV